MLPGLPGLHYYRKKVRFETVMRCTPFDNSLSLAYKNGLKSRNFWRHSFQPLLHYPLSTYSLFINHFSRHPKMSYEYAWEDPIAKDSYDPKYVEFLLNDYLPKNKQIIAEHQEELDKIENSVLRTRRQSEIGSIARESVYLPIDDFKDEVVVTDETIPGIDGTEIPIKVYKPKDVGPLNAVYINFHGGGFVLGDLTSDVKPNYWLVHLAGVTVIDVGYRLIPEWTFSTAFYDSYAAVKYVKENSEKFGIDPNKIAIGGTSAGGKIVLAAAHVARDLDVPVNLVIANVPPAENFLDVLTSEDAKFPGSFIKFDKDPFLTIRGVRFFEEARRDAERTAQRIDANIVKEFFKNVPELDLYEAPILEASNYRSLPKHIVYVGEHDVLGDGGRAYAKKLIDNGVEVNFRVARGLGHLHSFWTNIFDESKKYLYLVANELKRLQSGDYSS